MGKSSSSVLVPDIFCSKSQSGSQFEEVYVGLGAKRIRELFEAAKQKSPAIIFIDEIDAVGGSRKLKDQSALKQTLNELLVQMDGFEENSGESISINKLVRCELIIMRAV